MKKNQTYPSAFDSERSRGERTEKYRVSKNLVCLWMENATLEGVSWESRVPELEECKIYSKNIEGFYNGKAKKREKVSWKNSEWNTGDQESTWFF